MTTVVWVKGKLVSDSQRTRAGVNVKNMVQKIFVPCEAEGEEWKIFGKRVVAFGRAGNPGVEHFIKEALASKEGVTHRTDLKITSKLSGSFIVIDENHRGWLIHCSYKQAPNTPDQFMISECFVPTSIGSGSSFVDSVLALGEGVKKALKVAKDLDPHSGGKTQVVKLPKKVKLQK